MRRASPLGGLDIVCLAGMDWDENWTSRQQLMSRLAARHRVLYVERLRSPFTRFSGVLGGQQSVAQVAARGHTGRDGGLLVVTRPPGRLPLPYDPVVNRLNAVLTRRWLRREVRRLGWQRPDVLWTFEPDSAPVIGSLGERLSVYHCVDQHAAYGRLNSRFRWARPAHQIAERETDLLRRVDLVLASSAPLQARLREQHPATYMLRHGVDLASYGRAAVEQLVEPADVSGLRRPIAGFIGMIDGRLDAALMSGVARALSDWSFVFVGHVRVPTPATAQLRALPNVYFLGFRPLAQLPSYLRAIDVGLIPYGDDAFTRAVFPLKLFEYLAAGKGVVSTPLQSLHEFVEAGVLHLAGDVSGFAVALSELVSAPAGQVEHRVRLAAQHTWDQRVLEVEGLVETALVRRI